MASFKDYVNQDSGLESEITEAAKEKQARDAQTGRFVPERFKDKDITDVIQSYEELEKLNSRQAQDLGNMRSQVDELMRFKAESNSPAEVVAKPLTVDDIYENPDEAVRRVAKETLSSEVTELRNTITEIRQKQIVDEMEAKYPNWLEVSQSDEFSTWVRETPYREHMVKAVRESSDLAAAQELLGMYYDQNPPGKAKAEDEQRKAVVKEQVRNATLESGGPSPVELEDTYSRNDLLDARLAAKAGDLKAERWLTANSGKIAAAYAEGRIVD